MSDACHCIACQIHVMHCIACHCIACHDIACHCIAGQMHVMDDIACQMHCTSCIACHCIALHVMTLHCMSCIALHVMHCMSCIACHCIALHVMTLHCMSDACHALHLTFTCNKPYTVFAQCVGCQILNILKLKGEMEITNTSILPILK